jgi:DNA-binding response OmpR family regulator
LTPGAADWLSVPYVFAELQAVLRALARRAKATEALVEHAPDS